MSPRETFRALFWPLMEAATAVVAGAVAVLVIAKIIGAEDFGLGSIALGTILTLQVATNSLVHDSLVRSKELSSDDIDVAFTASTLVALTVGGLTALAAPVVGYFLDESRLPPLIWALLPILVFSALPITIIAELRRSLNFFTLAIHQISGRILGAVIGVISAFCGAGVWSLVAQYTVTAAYILLALYAAAPRWPRFQFSWRRLAPMLRFCSPITASQFVIQGGNWLFLLAMGRWHGLGAAGHWSVATRIAESLLGAAIQAVYNVGLARMALHQRTHDRLGDVVLKVQALTSLPLVPLLVALAAAAEPMIVLLLGRAWAAAGQLAIGPLIACYFLARQIVPSTALRVVGNSSVSLVATISNVVFACVALVLFGYSSPLVISTIYALSVLPGYVLIYLTAAQEFHLPVTRELAMLLRDAAVGTTAFWMARGAAGQLSEPISILGLVCAASVAFTVAAILLILTNLKLCWDLRTTQSVGASVRIRTAPTLPAQTGAPRD